jgi:polyisoprenoid-binding protein YceI
MPRIARSAALVLLAALATFITQTAGADTLTLDPAKTRVDFTLGATMHSVKGSFRLERGTIQLDRSSSVASGEIVLDAKSAQTGNDGRDRDMHAKVLESAKFPKIVFRVERLEGKVPQSGRGDVKLHGTLEFHGDRHPFTIPAQVNLAGGQVTGTARFRIPYVAWGLTDPSKLVLRVDKEVAVELKVVGKITG